eukprot:g8497.t1
MSIVAAKTASFVRGTPLKLHQSKTRISRTPVRLTPCAKYGDKDQYFDLDNLEDTVGSWDLYGQQDEKRYPDIQNEFFERAGSSLSRKEAIRSLLFIAGAGTFVLFGLKGSKDANLPIIKGPQTSGEKGPRGKI